MHLSLYKTFGTPHGGRGTGLGAALGVVEKLVGFLLVSRVNRRTDDGTLFLDYDQPDSIGYAAPF